MISLKKDNVKEMSDRQLSSNEIEKVLELQNSTLLRRLPAFGFPDFGFGHSLPIPTEDSDVTIFSNQQKNVEGMLEQQKMIQNLLKHYQKNLGLDGHWLNSKNADMKCKKRFSAGDLDLDKRRDADKPVKENIPMEEVKNKLGKVKKDEDGKVFSKQRKTNFTSKEVETLLDCVRKKKEVILFGVAGGRGWAKAWQDIAKVVTKVEGIPRSEGDVRKKWTYLKWEAKNTSKPGRDPVSKQVLNILTSRDREVQEAMNLRNMDFPDDGARKIAEKKMSCVKRKAITIETKLSVIKMLESGARKSEVCKLFGLVNSSVGSIWKARDKIKSIQSKSLKKIRRPAYENLDAALIKWFREQKMLNLPLNGASLKTKAQELAKELEVGNFECSNGWIDRFKKRYNISFAKGSPGEDSNTVDFNWPKEWPEVGEVNAQPEGNVLSGSELSVPPANSAQQQLQQQQQQTPQASPQSQPQPSPPPSLNQKKSGLPPLAPKPSGAKLPQSSSGTAAPSIKQLPKLLPKPQQSPPEVCLRWNSYHSNMQNTFPSLLNNEQFVDVTLACDGRSIKCHKVMLSACSPYMEELLSSNPCQHPIIFLKDMKFWQLQALIDFMYRGEVNVTQDKLPSLLSAAEALQIKGLASPVNHSAPPKITQVQPMPSAQHDLSEEMDQVTYMRHLQLQTDVKNEYEDEYMQDTDESPPPTPKPKRRKTCHVILNETGSGNNSSNSNSNSQKQPTLAPKPKREKERHSEPSTSHHHQMANSASSQALPNTLRQDQRRKSDNSESKMTARAGADSENEYKNYIDDNRHSTIQDDELDIDEEHAQIILERYSSQNDDYSRGGGGGGGGDGDPDEGEGDDNSMASG